MPELYKKGNSHRHAVFKGKGSPQVALTSTSVNIYV